MTSDPVDCSIFFGPGWWPCITEDMYNDLLSHIGRWCVQYDLANIDIVVQITQQEAPVD